MDMEQELYIKTTETGIPHTYKINLKNKDFYFPRVERWVMDTFNLKLTETILYGLILVKGRIIWDYSYIGKILNLSKATAFRLVESLVNKGIVEKRTKLFNGNRQRTVLVALYTKEGLRSQVEINRLFNDGFNQIAEYYEK